MSSFHCRASMRLLRCSFLSDGLVTPGQSPGHCHAPGSLRASVEELVGKSIHHHQPLVTIQLISSSNH